MSNSVIFQISLETWGAIFCLVCCSIIYVSRKATDNRSMCLELIMIVDSIQLFSDVFAYFYRGVATPTGFFVTRVANLAVFAMNIFILLLLCVYARILMEANGYKPNAGWLNFFRIYSIIVALVMIWSQTTNYIYGFDSNNYYYRGPGYWIFLMLALIMMLAYVLYIMVNRRGFKKTDFACFMLMPILYVGSIVIQTTFYGLSLSNIALVVSLMVFFVRYEIYMSTKMINQDLELHKERVAVAEKSAELADYRAKLLLSQIQPHFLFNSLTAIKALTSLEPEKAGDAVDRLASFLRASLDSLSCTTTVPIEKELKTTEDYLIMEKYRFGKKLEIEVVADTETFQIPPFSIQPLVENAIHHGIRKKISGRGKITVRTKENSSEYIIEIIDDGTGYDVDKAFNDGRNHYGVNIVRQRLIDMCEGNLEIKSELGVGTTCIIRIPKDKKVEA